MNKKILKVYPEFISKCWNLKYSIRSFTGKPLIPPLELIIID